MADEQLKSDREGGSQQADEKRSAAERGDNWLERAFKTVMRDGSIAALGREAWKDVGDAWYQVAYGQVDHGRELGGPLTPLASDLEEARGKYDPSPAATARGGQGQESTGSGKSTGGEAVRGRGSEVQARGESQYAQLSGAFLSELPPVAAPEVATPVAEPAPVVEPVPTAEPAPQQGGTWADRVGGETGKDGGSFGDAVKAERGQEPNQDGPWLDRLQRGGGNEGGGESFVDRLTRNQGEGGNEGGGWVERLQREQDGADNEGGAGGRGRSLSVEQAGRDRGR